MGEAANVVKAWVKAIGKGPVESTQQYLSPKLDWLENGLTYDQSVAENPRGKWMGVRAKNFTYKAKEVSGDDRTTVMEFTAGAAGQEFRYCGVFKVSRGKIVSAHWYGDHDKAVRASKGA